METNDFSKEIYNKYYNKSKLLEITLKDNTVLEGKLVSFFHGDPSSNEPFIIRWHFVAKGEIEMYQKGLDTAIDSGQETGKIIEQKNIKHVRFKQSQ